MNCIDCKKKIQHKSKRCRTCYLKTVKSNNGKRLVCKECGKKYTYSKKKGHTLSYCNTCKTRLSRKKLKLKAIKYKGGECKLCGYRKNPTSLSFHHIDSSKKEAEISRLIMSVKCWNTIKKELDKCVLLCANCHLEVHAGVTELGL